MRRLILFVGLIALTHSAGAQVTATRPIYDEIAGTSSVGSLTYPGWDFGTTGLPLVPNSSWAQIALIGKFQAATQAANPTAILNNICTAERAEYADLVDNWESLQVGAHWIAPLTQRKVVAMAYFGRYTIVFAKLSGAGIDPFLHHYVVKNDKTGPLCMTNELKGNVAFNLLSDLIYAAHP
ncbi:MAG: hypothetical protein M3Z16_03205 [Pseudomonadota bacterium]|nr:hypothetical protein [Pseudomonadota bacterium]